VLLPREFHSSDMRLPAVNRLADAKSGQGSRSGKSLDLENRVAQVLVKPSAFNDPNTFQIMLEQQIVVIGMRGLKVGITF